LGVAATAAPRPLIWTTTDDETCHDPWTRVSRNTVSGERRSQTNSIGDRRRSAPVHRAARRMRTPLLPAPDADAVAAPGPATRRAPGPPPSRRQLRSRLPLVDPPVDVRDLRHPSPPLRVFQRQDVVGRPVKVKRDEGYLPVGLVQGVADYPPAEPPPPGTSAGSADTSPAALRPAG
jgi:hypothetical protein